MPQIQVQISTWPKIAAQLPAVAFADRGFDWNLLKSKRY